MLFFNLQWDIVNNCHNL